MSRDAADAALTAEAPTPEAEARVPDAEAGGDPAAGPESVAWAGAGTADRPKRAPIKNGAKAGRDREDALAAWAAKPASVGMNRIMAPRLRRRRRRIVPWRFAE